MSERVVVVDYSAGNLRSAAKALSAAGAEHVIVAGDAATIASADRIVLPGVGAFAHCVGALRGVPGLAAALDRAVHGRGVPFLGICVGMQLLADEGHEHGVHPGLGWLPGRVERLKGGPGLKVPHIGWNDVTPVCGGLVEAGSGYFVHSYRFVAADAADVVATVDYGEVFPAVVAHGNVTGVQFHPEKSQGYGLGFLRRWLSAPLPEREGLGVGLALAPAAGFLAPTVEPKTQAAPSGISPIPNPSRSGRGAAA